MKPLIRYAFAAAVAVAAAYAQAGVGVTQVRPSDAKDPVTVFYPTAAEDRPVRRGPFEMRLAERATPIRGNGRLIVISHGSGGNPWVHSDLARALVDAGFVVAMPQHHGDNAFDHSDVGPRSWKQRPVEVSKAIDAVAADARFAPLLALDKVGMYGMSAGGHTALTLAGGRWSPSQLKRHCEAHIAEDFATCVGLTTKLQGNALDEAKIKVALTVIRGRHDDETWYSHTDPRIQAVVAGVPFAVDFDPASLASPQVALALVTASRDKWLLPKFHSDALLQACAPRCERLANFADGGHGALMSPLPPVEVLGEIERDLLADPPGFDRRTTVEVDRKIAGFFAGRLK